MHRCDAKVHRMRTTIRIDDELLRRTKLHAAQTRRTVGQVVEDALRAALAARPESRQDVAPLPSYGGSGVLPGVDLSNAAALRDVMDEAEPVDALR